MNMFYSLILFVKPLKPELREIYQIPLNVQDGPRNSILPNRKKKIYLVKGFNQSLIMDFLVFIVIRSRMH